MHEGTALRHFNTSAGATPSACGHAVGPCAEPGTASAHYCNLCEIKHTQTDGATDRGDQ